ncbi:MAG: MarR family winged helix-turn-helix transcriptional regulator [Opitutaceae bacterium]
MHLALEILRTAKTIERAAKRTFAPFGVTPAHFNVLNLLGDAPEGLRSADLARELVVDPSNVTGLLRRMAKEGYVTEIPNAADGRSRLIRLTRNGRQVWRKVLPAYERRLAELTRAIPAAETAKASAVIERLGKAADGV